MGIGFSQSRFEYLEKNRHNQHAILVVFDEFDTNSSGKLEGFEAANFIEGLAQYLYQTKFNPAAIDITFSEIRLLINDLIDRNHDGKFDRSEVCNNLCRIFSEVETIINK